MLGSEDGDFSLSSFEGRSAPFRDVHEVLSTVAMFGGRRLAVVEEADEFVTRYRAQLEDYVARPGRGGVLALELSSLPSNTRLYKSIAAEGLLIDCATPTAARQTFTIGAVCFIIAGIAFALERRSIRQRPASREKRARPEGARRTSFEETQRRSAGIEKRWLSEETQRQISGTVKHWSGLARRWLAETRTRK